MDRKKCFLYAALASFLVIAGCGGVNSNGGNAAGAQAGSPNDPTRLKEAKAAGTTPSFSLWWSEYPSWSTFGVADKLGFVNGKAGVLGPIEQKWGVDIVLKQADYDPCIQAFGGGQADAVCITNMDVLSPSLGRTGTAICPTSTSFGADAIIVTHNIKSLADLRGKKIYGLEKSVSQYLVVRALEQNGMKESDITFSQMDPGAAAQAMQGNQANFEAIVVWEPYVTQTLARRKDVHVLVDSTKIKGEIVDMIVVTNDVLKKSKGGDFAHALIDAYYEVNRWLTDPKTSDTTHVALGEKFSNLSANEMKGVLTRCKFFGTPEQGLAVYNDPGFPDIMAKVVGFSKDHGMVTQQPTIRYLGGEKVNLGVPAVKKIEDPSINLTFDPSYMATLGNKK